MSSREYWVYILRCADSSYYTGVTDALEYRVWDHQAGPIEGCYTHSRRPVKLVYAEETNDIGAAIYREKQIKRWSRKKKEALIHGDEAALSKLSYGKGKWFRYYKAKK